MKSEMLGKGFEMLNRNIVLRTFPQREKPGNWVSCGGTDGICSRQSSREHGPCVQMDAPHVFISGATEGLSAAVTCVCIIATEGNQSAPVTQPRSFRVVCTRVLETTLG